MLLPPEITCNLSIQIAHNSCTIKKKNFLDKFMLALIELLKSPARNTHN